MLQLSYKLPASFVVSLDYIAKAVVISVSMNVDIMVLAVVRSVQACIYVIEK